MGYLSLPVRRTQLYRQLRRAYHVCGLRGRMKRAHPLNVFIGGGNTAVEGWFSTDIDVLDITSPRDWISLFKPGSIDRILAEHVLEHLSESECRIALKQCYCYLKKGGLLRIGVPDGYRKDAVYVAEVSPPRDGHRVLFTIDKLVPFLESIGFRVTPLEYFDARGKFHAHPWDKAEGLIKRSFRFDNQARFKRGNMFYTSLIVDAIKD